VRRIFCREFRDVTVPHEKLFVEQEIKLRQTGSLGYVKNEMKLRGHNEKKFDKIGARLQHSPRKSLRSLVQKKKKRV